MFRFQCLNPQSLLNGLDPYVKVEGQFNKGLPDGAWYLSFGSLSSSGKSSAQAYRYFLKTSGTQHNAFGEMKEGLPDGEWIQEVVDIENSQVIEQLFKSSVTYAKGVPQKSFSIENEQSILMGRLLRDGTAHDEWEVFSKQNPSEKEYWHFAEGELTRIVRQDEAGMDTVSFAWGDKLETMKLPFAEQFLQLVHVWKQVLTPVDKHKSLSMAMPKAAEIEKLMTEYFRLRENVDTIFQELNRRYDPGSLLVQAPVFTWKRGEVVALDSLCRAAKRSEEMSRSLLSNTQLQMLKLTSEEAAFFYELVHFLQQTYLQSIASVCTLYEQDLLKHVPRNRLSEYLFPESSLGNEVQVGYQHDGTERFRTWDGPALQSHEDGVDKMLNVARYIESTLASVRQILYKTLTIREREEKLSAYEAQLIAQVNNLQLFTDSLILHAHVAKDSVLLKNIHSAAVQELSSYSQQESTPAKLEQAKALVRCFRRLPSLASAVAHLHLEMNDIDSLYTERVWNPFTVTLMDEKVKKRITASYFNHVVPYLRAEVKTKLTCGKAQKLAVLFEALHKRMYEMREEDTTKIERKLRGEENPQVILEIFKIDHAYVGS